MKPILIKPGARLASYNHFHSTKVCMCTPSRTSRLTVVSHAAKQSRTGDTTVCYIHERSILIERSLKLTVKTNLMKKPRAILNPLTIIRHVRLIQNNYSLPFFNNTLWNAGQSVVFFFFSSSSSSFSFAYSLRMWALVPKIFETYISTCVLARAMKLLIQAFQ